MTAVATYETLIARNKRRSQLLIGGVSFALITVCTVFWFVTATYKGGDPAASLFNGLVFGGCTAIAAALISYFAGQYVIAFISDAYRVYHHDDPLLFNVVEEMAIAAGLPTPRIYVIYDDSLNAFAAGRDPSHACIGITSALRKSLNRDELQAVIAHEMAHIRNYDTRLMMLIGVFAGIIVLLSDFFLRHLLDLLKPSLGRKRAVRMRSGKALNVMYMLLYIAGAVALAWLAPVFARLMQLAVSREREYLADATAVQLCRNPEALISALRTLALDEKPLRFDNRATEHMFIINPDPTRKREAFNKDSVWSTHPPVVKRIARVAKLAREIRDENETL